MSAYTYDECMMCGEHIYEGDGELQVGGEPVHERCGEDPMQVTKCPYCTTRVLIEDTGDWTPCSDGTACPECAKDLEPETAETITAGYAPAGQRNPLIDLLDEALRGVTL